MADLLNRERYANPRTPSCFWLREVPPFSREKPPFSHRARRLALTVSLVSALRDS